MRLKLSAFAVVAAVGCMLLPATSFADTAGARVIADDDLVIAADMLGANVYWVEVARSGRTVLKRFDGASNAVTTVYSSPNARNAIIDVAAGGSRVAVTMLTLGRTRIASTIKTFGADGSPGPDIAYGFIDGPADCGTLHNLLDVAADGEVFVSSIDRARTRVTCGDAANGDTVTITGYGSATRNVFQTTGPINNKSLFKNAITGGEVNGASLAAVSLRGAVGVNLTSGATASYPTTMPGGVVAGVSVDGGGRVVVDEVLLKRKKYRKRVRGKLKTKYRYSGRSVVTMYDTPLSAAGGRRIFDSKRKAASARFCGSRVLRSTAPFDRDAIDTVAGSVGLALEEINDAGAVVRSLFPTDDLAVNFLHSCDSGNALVTRLKLFGSAQLLMVPLN